MAFFLTLFLFAAFTVLGELLRPKPDQKNAQPAGIGDFQLPTATEDRKIPLMWGTVQIRGPNVVWYGDLLQEPINERVRTGLFGHDNVTIGFRYHLGIQFEFCEGPIDGLRRMWIKDTLVIDATAALIGHGDTFTIDAPDLFGGDDLGHGGFVGTFQLFCGAPDQIVSPYLAQFQTVEGQTPAYRYYCYIAPATEAAYVGNSTSIDEPRFELQRITSLEANVLGLETPTVGTLDANPANVLYESLINTKWGRGIPVAEIDRDSFLVAAGTLKDEANGFSFHLENEEGIDAMIARLEKQIDGQVIFNLAIGKWQLKLARDDYDVTTIPSFIKGPGGNVIEIVTFTQGTYEETTNNYSVEFVDRADDYKTTFAPATNDANVEVQGGNRVYAGDRYPGVKEGALADTIAWRDLRTVSSPLAFARVITDRTTYAVNPLDVVLLTFTARDYSIQDRPMRVRSIDRGHLLDGRITYELVEDVFRAGSGSWGPPSSSGGTPPIDQLVPFPADEQLAFEAPRAITSRDPLGNGPTDDKVYAAGRQQDSAALFDIFARHASGAPSGSYADIGTVARFMKIGELASSIDAGDDVPRAMLAIESDPDSQAAILAELPGSPAAAPSETAIGTGLLGLIVIDSEFMLVSYAEVGAGTQVNLHNVFRGALDSVQTAHASGTPVFLLFVGAGISDESITAGHNVDVKLLPRSYSDSVTPAEAVTISFAMENRTRRPYAPSELTLNGVRFDDEVSLEGGDGTGEAIGIDLEFLRRDFRTDDEVESLRRDAASIDPSYPSANSTEHEVDVVDDPDGAASLLFTQDLGSDPDGSITRLDILRETDGVLPTRLRFALRSRHVFGGSSYDSRHDLEWDFDLTSELTGQFNFGARQTGLDSNIYTANAAGTHAFVLSSAFPGGDVQYRLNGGVYQVLIAAGTTTGNIPGVTVGDTIRIRHFEPNPALKLITMAAPGAGTDAYGVLWTPS